MKRVCGIIVALLSVMFGAAACSGRLENVDNGPVENMQQEVEISLWTFPVGNWGNPTAVASLLTGFQREHPEIHVFVEYLDYEDGDGKINQAIADGSAPDLVFEGPERLVAGWGDQGRLVDLSDLWDTSCAGQIYENIRAACQHKNGAYYVFPVCMSAHCMAVNYELFQKAGALSYLNEETHTWTTQDFIKAVKKLSAYGQKQVGVVYCRNQGGDQGTRALVNNLYGGSFTDAGHTRYTINSGENQKALRLLSRLEGISFDDSMVGSDEIKAFCSGELAMAFCWNAAIEIQQTIHNPNLDFDVFPMAFPTDSGEPRLQGGIYGFGIFDNGSRERIEAAKALIRYMTESDTKYESVVQMSSNWPVRDIGEVYENDQLMTEYSIFMPYVDDYYQITPGWTNARMAWWQMLQKIGSGEDIAAATKAFSKQVEATHTT